MGHVIEAEIEGVIHYIETLDEPGQRKLLRDWRSHLLHMTEELQTSASRKDWLFHMTQRTHSLPELVELISDFNQLQKRGAETAAQSLDLIQLTPHQLGVFFGKKSLNPFNV